MNKKSQKGINKPQEDTRLSWMVHIHFSPSSVFVEPGGLDGVSTEVGLYSDWGAMIPYGDESKWYKYGTCVIPLYACTFCWCKP